MFIAGCEATTKPQRDAILDIVDQAGTQSGLLPFKTARDIMSDVWRRQDEQQVDNIGDPLPTWMDVLKERGLLLMFC
jgi:arginine metabolism regulation protein II